MDLWTYESSNYAKTHNIPNSMEPKMIERAAKFILNCVEPLEALFAPRKIIFHSGYRSQALNDALPGSSKTSQHMQGNAMDFDVEGLSCEDTYRIIRNSSIRYDQLILEGREGKQWVHVSYNTDLSWSEQRMDAKTIIKD